MRAIPFPPEDKAKIVAAQLGLTLVRELAKNHDHLQSAEPMGPLDFAQRLIAWCYRFEGSVSSWGRTNTHNAKVEGVPDSKHQDWLAGDVVYD